jgi:hypothetical protein
MTRKLTKDTWKAIGKDLAESGIPSKNEAGKQVFWMLTADDDRLVKRAKALLRAERKGRK